MAKFNRITIVGNIGKDAEVREINADLNVITFNVAVTQKYKDKEHSDWFTCDMFCKSAGLAQYLTKGTCVLVDGSMVSHEYEKDGQKRTAWSVRAEQVELLGKREGGSNATDERLQTLRDAFGM